MDNATAVRWKLNAITRLNNNSSGNQSKRGFDRTYGGQADRARQGVLDLHEAELREIAEVIGRWTSASRSPPRSAGASAGAEGRPTGCHRRRHRNRCPR